MSVAKTIATSVRAALEQVAPTVNVDLVSSSIGRSAAGALAADPVTYLLGATSAFGASAARISVERRGTASEIRIEVALESDLRDLAAVLECSEPEWHHCDAYEWLYAARDMATLSIVVTGAKRQLCQCEAARAERERSA